MLISAFAALVLFAAPEAAQGSSVSATETSQQAAEAKPVMRKVCTTIEVSGSNLPKKKCKTVPVKGESAKVAEDASSKGEATKSE